jgi:hypothetical protein
VVEDDVVELEVFDDSTPTARPPRAPARTPINASMATLSKIEFLRLIVVTPWS